MQASSRSEFWRCTAAVLAVLLGLYLSSLYSYLLFHSLIEISTIAIAFALFMLAWHARGFLGNDCFKLLGIGYASTALLDLLHCLAYRGMNVFPGYGDNLPAQLWIAARYLQVATLCAAPLFARRRIDDRVAWAGCLAAGSAMAVLIFSRNFPDCFLEGSGLTPFKIYSEYAMVCLLLLSAFFFHRSRADFNERVLALIISSIGCTILSEIAFTAFLSLYGFANLLGHLCKFLAFYLIYRALLVTGFKEPYLLIFHDLKQTQEALQEAHDTLEEQVGSRTEQLRRSEGKYRALFEESFDGLFITSPQGNILDVNTKGIAMLGYESKEEVLALDLERDIYADRRDRKRILAEVDAHGMAEQEISLRKKGGGGMIAQVSLTAVRDESGEVASYRAILRDNTEKKLAEEALRRLNRELRAISNCNQVLMRVKDEQTLLAEICHIVCEQAGYRMAWVGFAENDAAKTVRPVAWAGVEQGYLGEATITWADTRKGGGPCGRAIRGATSVSIPDLCSDAEMSPWRESALQRGYRSCAVFPLKDQAATVYGVLCIYAAHPDAFPPEEIRLLEELAGDLAFGVTVLRSEQKRREAEESLHRFSQELEQRVAERTAELETKNAQLDLMNRLFVGRELRMAELKERIRALEMTGGGP